MLQLNASNSSHSNFSILLLHTPTRVNNAEKQQLV